MYSPQIRSDLVPAIYRAAKEDGVPMTVWVSRELEQALSFRATPEKETMKSTKPTETMPSSSV